MGDVWMTISAWAATLGISRQAAHKAVKRGQIPLVEGRLEATRATAIYRATTRQRVRHQTASASSDAAQMSYDEARRRQAVAEACRAEVELAARMGELVSAADVRAVFARHMVAARDRLLNISSRLAPVLANEADAVRIANLIDEEVHQALGELTRGAAALGSTR
jgi:hypothetical protein